MAASVVMVIGPGPTGRILYHALSKGVEVAAVIQEQPSGRARLLRRRVRTLGIGTVIGQLLFMATVVPVMAARSHKRIASILESYGLIDQPIDMPVLGVPSVNSEACHTLLRQLAPIVVVLAGTRILGKATMNALDGVPTINVHAGITPLYRGVHGGYWALMDGRPDLVGSTVHLVDKGIDTGDVIAHAFFSPTPDDNFATYPYLHLGCAIEPLQRAIGDTIEGGLTTRPNPLGLPSALRTHPTLLQYLGGMRRGVR